MLVDRGAGLDVRDPTYGYTPLSLAVMKGHYVIAKLLLSIEKVGTDVKDNCGRTPLFFAAWYGRDTVANAILINDAVDPDQKDYYGSTPLSIAVRHGHMEVVKMLLASGIVTCDSQDCFGRSVFWWAKRSGNADIEKMLANYSKERGIPMCGDEYVDVRSIPSDHLSRYCNACTLDIPKDSIYYRCGICNRGDFDICMECYELEGRCLQDGHGMIRMKDGMLRV